jgi:hypothetical protein
MIAIIAVVCSIAGIITGAFLYRAFSSFDQRLTILEKQIEIGIPVVTKDHYRHNEISAMGDIAAQVSALEAEIGEMTGRLYTVRLIANSIAKNPKKYNPDKSSKEQL